MSRVWIVALLMFATATQGMDRAHEEPRRGPDLELPLDEVYDCGTLALSLLLRIEGRPTAIDVIDRHLGKPPDGGYNLAELQAAASSCGLHLVGVRLARGDKALDRPALVHLRRGRHGHFAVVRPVGHSGRLVQVIDPGGLNEVKDATILYADRTWTGVALVPVRAGRARLAVATAATLLLAMGGAAALGWLRR